jgi:very-short-patch-repair endonuclease
MKSRLEGLFLHYWRALDGPALVREHAFAEGRRWRFDFALPALRVGIEVEGGQWTGGRHTRPAGYAADCEKYNAAAMAGWRVLRFTSSMVRQPNVFLAPAIGWIAGGCVGSTTDMGNGKARK